MTTQEITRIEPKALCERLGQGQALRLLDVRTPVEFRDVHLKASRNAPLHHLCPEEIEAWRDDPNEPLYVVCQSGGRAADACTRLTQAGLSNVVFVEGGVQTCADAGFPVVCGKKGMSLERQVRIAAGVLVVVGVALGAWLHPAWLALAAFVGTGLVFAGVTNTCGMALLLARMPWNR